MAFSVNSPLFKLLAIGAIAPTVWLVPRAFKSLPPWVNVLGSAVAVCSLLTLNRELRLLTHQESRQRRLLLAAEEIFDFELAREVAIAEIGDLPELPQSQPVQGSTQNTTPPEELPPVKDLGREIAELKRHVIFVASTTSGKTTLITQVISHAKGLGHRVVVIDGKGDRRLTVGADQYHQANTPERAREAIGILQELVNKMGIRQDQALLGKDSADPITLIIDELNLIRIFLGQSSKEDLTMFTQLLTHLLLQGASAKIYLRVSAHTSRVNALGLDGGVLDSLSFIALGRGGAFESLEDLLEYQIKGRKSRRYQDELDGLFNLDFAETLVFSTLKPMGFFRLPLVTPAVVTTPQHYQQPQNDQELRSQLDRIYQQSPAPEPDYSEPENADELMEKILEYAKKKGTVTPSQCKSNIRALKQTTTEQIRALFRLLVIAELGSVNGDEFTPF